MSWRFESIPHRRAIIDRRDLSDALIELGDDGHASIRRQRATQILKEALDKGRPEINRLLQANPGRGSEISASHAFLPEQPSEARRVGKERVRTCRFRWSQCPR